MAVTDDFIIGFDHAVVLQRDLPAAAEAYQKLGFRVSQRNAHPGGGTANHVILFPREYLELLTITDRTPMNEQLAQLLDFGGNGLRLLSLGTSDAVRVKHNLEARGVASFGPHALTRTHTLPDGGAAEAAFVVTVPMPVGAPLDAHVFVTEHKTPEYAYAPDGVPHPNGATGMFAIAVPVAELPIVATKLEQLASARPRRSEADFIELDTGTVPLRFVRQGAWAHGASTALITFTSADVAQTRAWFAENEIACEEDGDAVIVNDGGFGISLRFEPA